MPETSRIRVLALYRILYRETDEDRPLSAEELCARLREQGVKAERKTLYRDIAALRAGGTDILFTRKPRAGFFFAARAFEPPEVRLLMDAVLAAPFITEKKTAELLGKLRGLMSEGQAGEAADQIYREKRMKHANEEIYYNIDAVTRAIAQKKKVAFEYFHRVISGSRAVPDAGRRFVVSPYALLWESDRYYLAGNYEKYDSLSNYRLDRMKRVEVLDSSIRPFEEVCEYRGFFDTADYAKKTFRMYHGERQTVELRCADGILENILDKFGEDLSFSARDGESFTVRAEVYVGEGFLEWLLQFGGNIEVLSPEPLRREMAERTSALAALYATEGSG